MLDLLYRIVDIAFQGNNIIFSSAIAVFFFFGIPFARTNSVRVAFPTILVSIGILGTFFGIFIGLLNFDTKNINDSIPLLLEGMKTAFVTSLLGIFASIILKCLYLFVPASNIKTNNPVLILKSIENALVASADSIKNLETTMVRCFQADNETSMVTLMKDIKYLMRENRDDIKKALNECIEKFSEMASKSLVEELQRVVDKFNTMLNELVGEAFKELNVSTQRLIEWQSQYKESIEKSFAELGTILDEVKTLNGVGKETLDRVNTLSEQFDSIDASLSSITLSSADISKQTENLANQNELLKSSIEAIQKIGMEAKEVIPLINEKMNEIILSMETAQKQANEFVEKTLTANTKHIETLHTKYAEDEAKHRQATQTILNETLSALQKDINAMTTGIENNQKQANEFVEGAIEHLKESNARFEKELEKNLNDSLNSLADVMLKVSAKVASDYEPLISKMRDIIELSQKIENGR